MRRNRSKQQPLFSVLPQLSLEESKRSPAGAVHFADNNDNPQGDGCFNRGEGVPSHGVPQQQESRCDPFATADFLYIPPGTFLMGSPEEEFGRDPGETLHEVTLTRGFLMQATPVTRRQWKAVMGTNPSSFGTAYPDCPVDGVSWLDCEEFIRNCNALVDHKYRLPTEAEWEYACRAGTSGAFADAQIVFSEEGRAPELDLMAWYSRNSNGRPHPVAQKAPNAWGLYDMHGNLCEWCEDWYGEYTPHAQQDPVAGRSGSRRVGRGGCWVSPARNCRCASRFSWPPGYRGDFVGFRLVREPQ